MAEIGALKYWQALAEYYQAHEEKPISYSEARTIIQITPGTSHAPGTTIDDILDGLDNYGFIIKGIPFGRTEPVIIPLAVRR
jgi:hypothetical protein